MKWFNEIMSGLKSFFSLEHDATEQEVHETLTKHGSLKSFQDSIRAEVGKELEAEKASLLEMTSEKERLEGDLKAANAKVGALEADVKRLEADLASQKKDLEAANTTIEKMKAEAADDPTTGPTDTPPKAGQNLWDKNPINQRAKAMRG